MTTNMQITSMNVTVLLEMHEERRAQMARPEHAWIALGIDRATDRVSFLCAKPGCDLRVSVMREGSLARAVPIHQIVEPEPTPEELARGGYTPCCATDVVATPVV